MGARKSRRHLTYLQSTGPGAYVASYHSAVQYRFGFAALRVHVQYVLHHSLAFLSQDVAALGSVPRTRHDKLVQVFACVRVVRAAGYPALTVGPRTPEAILTTLFYTRPDARPGQERIVVSQLVTATYVPAATQRAAFDITPWLVVLPDTDPAVRTTSQ